MRRFGGTGPPVPKYAGPNRRHRSRLQAGALFENRILVEFEHLNGQRYRRPGSQNVDDVWQVVGITHDDSGQLATLRSSEGEQLNISVYHLREPYWQRAEIFENLDD